MRRAWQSWKGPSRTPSNKKLIWPAIGQTGKSLSVFNDYFYFTYLAAAGIKTLTVKLISCKETCVMTG